MYSLYPLADDLVQVVLPKPNLLPPWGTPSNVYVVLGPQPALVGAGHPLSSPALIQALASLDVSPEDICRVVALDWSPEQVGGVAAFPRADLMLSSPDMQAPADYGAWLRARFSRLQEDARALITQEAFAEAMSLARFEEDLALYAQGLPTSLSFVPLREGHHVRLGRHLLRVLETPGPYEGHLCLWEESTSLLFSGRLAVERAFGDLQVEAARTMLHSIERCFDLQARVCLPTLGRVAQEEGLLLLRRANKHLVNILNHLPFLLQGNAAVPDVLRRDMGYIPSNLGRYLESVRFYEACFDELVRSGATLKQGEGVWATYGSADASTRMTPG